MMNTNTNIVNPADEIWAMLKDLARSQEETNRQMKESQRRIEKNLGGLGNSLGRLVEAMFSSKLCDKLNEFGYLFNTQANHKNH